jgi:predicted CopG family antitoxin
MTKYSTISIPVDVKKRLEKVKGKKEWGEFILDLYDETQKLKSKKAFNELSEIITQENLEIIAKSSKEFREKFAFS